MKGIIIDKLEQSALKTVDYFQSQLKPDGSFGKHAQDLACYFKTPLLFYAANKIEHSQFVLSYIQTAFMTEDGDFKTNDNLKSIKPEYAEFWCYPNGWIIRAAQKTNRLDILDKSYRYFLSAISDDNRFFLTNQPPLQNKVTDVLTIAHHGVIHLEQNNLELATIAGNFLCDVIDAQKQTLTTGFYLRFNTDKQIMSTFEQDNALFCFVDKHQPQQLYFMIGYPCAFLALLYKATDEKKYLEHANILFDFALSCHDSMFNSNFSHKIAWAASILYSIHKKADYLDVIAKISDHFLAHQSEHGLWFEQDDINTSYDQSAEIACWFLEIARNLK